MSALIKTEKDFYAGVLFSALGTAFAIGAMDYDVGTAANMGGGYFPLMLGILLALLGLVIAAGALRGTRHQPSQALGPIAWKPLFVVIAANVVFGICLGGIRMGNAQVIPVMGLVIGVFLLVVISSFAESKVHWAKVLGLAVALSVISYLTFIKLLGLRIPVFPVL